MALCQLLKVSTKNVNFAINFTFKTTKFCSVCNWIVQSTHILIKLASKQAKKVTEMTCDT